MPLKGVVVYKFTITRGFDRVYRPAQNHRPTLPKPSLLRPSLPAPTLLTCISDVTHTVSIVFYAIEIRSGSRCHVRYVTHYVVCLTIFCLIGAYLMFSKPKRLENSDMVAWGHSKSLIVWLSISHRWLATVSTLDSFSDGNLINGRKSQIFVTYYIYSQLTPSLEMISVEFLAEACKSISSVRGLSDGEYYVTLVCVVLTQYPLVTDRQTVWQTDRDIHVLLTITIHAIYLCWLVNVKK